MSLKGATTMTPTSFFALTPLVYGLYVKSGLERITA
jgi:hypothetical protein